MIQHPAQQAVHVQSKKKSAKKLKAKQSTQLASDDEAAGHQPIDHQAPVASPSALELVTIQPSEPLHEPTLHAAVLGPAVHQALAIAAAGWNSQYTLLAQIMQNNMALQMLETAAASTAITAPDAAPVRVNVVPLQSTAQHSAAGLMAEGPPRQQPNKALPAKPSSLMISKTICAFGRYHDTRPEGLTTDGLGRLSLNNVMQVWGTKAGLKLEEVAAAIQLHSHSEHGGPRYIINAMHNDFYIQVRSTTKHKARSNFDPLQAIGAARPPKRRRF